jgi:tetratricopeptide (TPR) repeat protein
VFAGGCTYEGAERVCDADPDTLQSLLDKSLLRRRQDPNGGSRYWMLETIREYAHERLEASRDADALRRRHASFFFELAASADDAVRLRPMDRAVLLNKLAAETENLRGVLAWALEDDVGKGLLFAIALRDLWTVRGHGRELARWFEAAFQRPEQVPAEVRVQALLTDGDIHALFLDENERGRKLYEEALRLARQLSDERTEARSLNRLGMIMRNEGCREEALALHEQALDALQRIGDSHRVADTLHLRADTLRDLGQFEQATEDYERAIALHERLGELRYASDLIHSFADSALDQRDIAGAIDRYCKALRMSVELDDKRTIAYCLAGLSCAAALSGELNRAGTLWAATQLFEDAYGSRMQAAERARYERLLADFETLPAFVTAFERGRALTLERALEHALQIPSAPT